MIIYLSPTALPARQHSHTATDSHCRPHSHACKDSCSHSRRLLWRSDIAARLPATRSQDAPTSERDAARYSTRQRWFMFAFLKSAFATLRAHRHRHRHRHTYTYTRICPRDAPQRFRDSCCEDARQLQGLPRVYSTHLMAHPRFSAPSPTCEAKVSKSCSCRGRWRT